MPNTKEFLLSQIAKLHYGNKFDKNKMTHAQPDVNFVSRTAANNGISDVVDQIDGVTPYPAGCVSLAFGGSIGSCFLQDKPFYTGQNVGVIEFSSDVPHEAKLYFVTALEKVCKAKYVTFSDEINKHFKTDLAVSLPVTTVMVPDWAALETLLKVHGGGAEMSKIDTSSWKKFKISDLFTAQTGNVDIQKTHINGKGISVVSSGVEGNGIIGKTDMDAKVFPAGTLTVDMFGNVFYRDFKYKMVTHARVFSMSLKDDVANMPVEIGLFLEASLKFLTQMFSFNNMCTFDKISDLEISLPVTTQDVPDWDYMQERIVELEQERIVELEQYLVAAGLNDYTLTEDDLKVLSLSGSGRDKDGNPAAHATVSKPMMPFVMHDVFNYVKVAKIPKKDVRPVPDDEFCIPVVYAKFGDNGIMYWGRKDEVDARANVISIVYNGAIAAGKVYAQEEPTGILAESYLIQAKNGDKIPFEANLYMSQVIEKTIYPQYSREFLAVWNDRVENNVIRLPIQTDDCGVPVIDEAKAYHPDGYVPDWEYMAAYIRVMEKLVIRDVVDYKDEFIRQHKLAVAGSGV